MSDYFKYLLSISLFFIATISCTSQLSFEEESKIPIKMRGITLVAPPKPFTNDPIIAVKNVHAEWVCLVPYGYTRLGKFNVYHNSDWQWWGEREEGVRESVTLAHKSGVKVMIKPQVYIPGGWVGDFDPKSETGWKVWEESYETYLFEFLKIAIDQKAEMFCIGTEYKIAVKKREKFWRALISKIRKQYSGKLVYSSNWDSYDEVPFWDALDYIGVSAYFPLSQESNPSQKKLSEAWNPIREKMKKFAHKKKKQILFTEYGYLSVDGCSGKTWELEDRIHNLSINESAQANALEALYAAFWDEDYWAGGFLWKWFPEMQGHEGYPAKDYTPQGKMAEKTVAKWYCR